MLLFANKIEIMPIFSIFITCSTAITKSILLAFVFENSFQLLHR